MNYKDKIIWHVSHEACKEISAKVVRTLRKMTKGMQSGDDTPLINIWDEVCVQVKVEQSVMWDAYEETILGLIEREVRKLDGVVIGAIWLRTDAGSDWESEIQDKIDEGEIKEWDQENVDCNLDDVGQYILQEYVLKSASDWTNKRIEKYIDEGYSL